MKDISVNTYNELSEFVSYSSYTGLFTWIKKSGNRGMIGNVAGTVSKKGYVALTLKKKLYQAHRIAWYFVNKEDANGEIDHINHNRSDNRISNLRVVSKVDNSRNQSKHTTNSSGVTGVSKRGESWRARITFNNRTINIGSFAEFSCAVDARKNAEVLYGFHENHGI